jgi:single-strand DNA-binding protein
MGERDIMSDINIVEIAGRLGSDPNEHRTDSGFAIAGMSVATNRNWKDRNTGEWQERTDWHQVSVFGKRAEWCISELKKGSRVRVVGRLQTDVVEDKYGQKKYYTKIVAQDINLE